MDLFAGSKRVFFMSNVLSSWGIEHLLELSLNFAFHGVVLCL